MVINMRKLNQYSIIFITYVLLLWRTQWTGGYNTLVFIIHLRARILRSFLYVPGVALGKFSNGM